MSSSADHGPARNIAGSKFGWLGVIGRATTMTFDGQELYPSLIDKASALGFSLIMNHPFVDGNKRAGHGALETFLVLNGCEIQASVDEQEKLFLSVAAGQCNRDNFTEWLRQHVIERRES